MSLQHREPKVIEKVGSDLSLGERAELALGQAEQLEKAGEYQAACEALAEFWPDRNGEILLEGLEDSTRAEMMLRAGVLSGWLGSADQTTGSQERAKNLITQSIEIFDRLGESNRVADARCELGLCYWREGAYDEARITLSDALERLANDKSELKVRVLIRAGIVEVDARRFSEGFRFYNEAAALLSGISDHTLQGIFHNSFGLALRRLAEVDNREDYLDQALMEYTAASFHFEQAGHQHYHARVENNLGYLFFRLGRHQDAHRHLDRARFLFLELRDTGTVAQVDETRARTLLAEGRTQEAERVIRAAVRTLEKGDEQSILAEALTTYGTVLARLGNYGRARALLERAKETAQTAGDLEGAGRVQLSMIEELADQTTAPQLVAAYESAAGLLQQSQDPAANKRLIACARTVIDALLASEQEEVEAPDTASWEGFSFKREVRKIEKSLIERALRDAGGSVSKAARLLGFKHHQSLIAIINSRHKDLREKRSAVRKRRKHLFSKPKRARGKTSPEDTEPSPMSA